MNKNHYFVFAAIVLMTLGGFYFYEPLPFVGAADNTIIEPLFGYAWGAQTADTDGNPEGGIGWISFNYKNCDSNGDGVVDTLNPGCGGNGLSGVDLGIYKVEMNISTNNLKNGELYGYAWSANYGWVKFGPAQDVLLRDILDAPKDPKKWAYLDGNKLKGWARACSVFVSGCDGALADSADLGGWDGWISLSGLTTTSASYGVAYDDGAKKFSGYAWGGGAEMQEGVNYSSQSPGWIKFSDTDGEWGVTVGQPKAGALVASCKATKDGNVFSPITQNTPFQWKIVPEGGTSNGGYKYGWGTDVTGPTSDDPFSVTVSYLAGDEKLRQTGFVIVNNKATMAECRERVVDNMIPTLTLSASPTSISREVFTGGAGGVINSIATAAILNPTGPSCSGLVALSIERVTNTTTGVIVPNNGSYSLSPTTVQTGDPEQIQITLSKDYGYPWSRGNYSFVIKGVKTGADCSTNDATATVNLRLRTPGEGSYIEI